MERLLISRKRSEESGEDGEMEDMWKVQEKLSEHFVRDKRKMVGRREERMKVVNRNMLKISEVVQRRCVKYFRVEDNRVEGHVYWLKEEKGECLLLGKGTSVQLEGTNGRNLCGR